MGYGYGNRVDHGGKVAYDNDGNRTKAVVQDSMVAHLWANQAQSHARTGNGNFFFHGRTIYSYGEHFPCGHILPDGVVLLNSDHYSVTTSQHQSTVRWALAATATRYAVPSLDNLLQSLRYKHDAKSYAERHGESIEPEAAKLLAKLSGLGIRSWHKATNDGIKARAKHVAVVKKREIAALILEGKQIAALSVEAFKATWPKDENPPSYQTSRGTTGKRYATQIARMHKAATSDKVKRAIWDKLKLLRAHVAGEPDRMIAARRRAKAQEIITWRQGGKRPESYLWESFPAIRRALQRAEQAERLESSIALYDAWLIGEGKRPDANRFPEDSDYRRAVENSEAWDAAIYEAAYITWQGDNSQPRPPASAFSYGDERWTLLHNVENAEKLAKAAKERADKEAEYAARKGNWLAGESNVRDNWTDDKGGALIRATRVERDESGDIIGGNLETSQGADVPLVHAVKVFQFIKLVRQRGKGWRCNGQQIRVGHFKVDSISASGDFVAGCHRFSWPEIERLATSLGVFAMPADDAAVKESTYA